MHSLFNVKCDKVKINYILFKLNVNGSVKIVWQETGDKALNEALKTYGRLLFTGIKLDIVYQP